MSEIVVPVDGSRFAEQALGFATLLARTLEGRLNLVHVVESSVIGALRAGWVESERAAGARYLDELRTRLAADVADVSVALREGQAAEEILRFADEVRASLIVMATRGRGGIGRLMLGSVADKVVRGAHIPVGLVRPRDTNGTSATSSDRLTRLLVPLDGSEIGERALPFAVQLAQRSGASLHLLRAIEPVWTTMVAADPTGMSYVSAEMIAEIEEALRVDAREYLEGVAKRVEAEGVSVTWETVYGRPATQIVRAAEESAADAIVISTHGRGGLRVALGSVTQEVLNTSDKPMLVVPPGAAPRESA
jgi:nucleotide-binding universal stress UspA family protein